MNRGPGRYRTPSRELLHTWFAGNIVASRSAASFEEVDRSLTLPGLLDSNLARGPPDDRRILVTDQLSSTLGETDSVGGVVGERRYTLYGEVREGDAPEGVGFHGARFQEEAGLYYLRNRWYEAELGRFVSRDPIGFLGGANVYRYSSNAPVSRRDPAGLRDWEYTYDPETGQWIPDKQVQPGISVGPSDILFDLHEPTDDLEVISAAVSGGVLLTASGVVIYKIGQTALTYYLLYPVEVTEAVAGAFGVPTAAGSICGSSCRPAARAIDEAIELTSGSQRSLGTILGPAGASTGRNGIAGAMRPQLTANACGPACGSQLLRESGLDVFQSNLTSGWHRGLTPQALAQNMNGFQQGWRGGYAYPTASQLAGLASRGPFIARIGGNSGHFVIVDSIADGVVRFRDPSGGVACKKSISEFIDLVSGIVHR